MRTLLAILLALTCSFGAQAQSKAAKKGHSKTITPCDEFVNLIQKRQFHLAKAIFNDEQDLEACNSAEVLRAKAQLEAAFMNFEEAERILLPLAQAYPKNDTIQREWNHMANLLGSSGTYQPIGLQPMPNPNKEQKLMIGWMEDSVPKLMSEQAGIILHYPIREKGRPYCTFSAADIEANPVLAAIQKKLVSKGYEDIYGLTFLDNKSVLVSCMKPLAYASKHGSYRDELVWFDEEGKWIGELPYMDCNCQNAHPSYDAASAKLYFASDREGGQGGMDIWSMAKSGNSWLAPENMGRPVNSSYHELMPTLSSDTLFFSSNVPYTGFGGYDLYAYQMGTGDFRNMGLPINSVFDEFSFNVAKPGKGLFVTNRNDSLAGHQIFYATWTAIENFFDQIKGQIESAASLAGMEVLLMDEIGEIIDRAVIDADNKFQFGHVKGKDNYRIEIPEATLDAGSSLQLFDGEDQKILDISATSSSGFIFELLTPKDYYINKMDNTDESILSVDIFGKMDNTGGLKIYLQNSDGETIASTYTSLDGNFKFNSVNADDKYNIKTEVTDGNKPIYILDADGEIIKTIEPDASGGFVYIRLDDSDGVITLTNEYQKRVKISQKDIFDVGVVNYAYNSADLPEDGHQVLDRLAEILKNNPQVRIELEGHTDSKGSESFNLELSKKRIASAIAYMRSQGVETYRLSGKGYGESRPVIACSDYESCDETAHAANRRIEFRLLDLAETTERQLKKPVDDGITN